MERRTFLKNGILAGVSVFTPLYFFSKSSNFEIIKLKPVQKHIRHGLLNDNFQKISDNILIQRNIFYKNGLSSSDEDILNINVRFLNKKINSCIFIEQNTIQISNSESVRIVNLSKNKTFDLKNGYILPISGNFMLENKIIHNEIIAKLNSFSSPITAISENAQFLIIS